MKPDIDHIILKIAESEQITPEEVLFHMEEAIDAAYHSSDPAVQAEWARMPFCSKLTPREFILYMAARITEPFSREH